MPSGAVFRILLITCAGMLPCDASLPKCECSNNSGLHRIPSARAVQMMSLGMTRVPRQEAGIMSLRVCDCLSSSGDCPVFLAHLRSIPGTTYQKGECDHGQPYPSGSWLRVCVSPEIAIGGGSVMVCLLGAQQVGGDYSLIMENGRGIRKPAYLLGNATDLETRDVTGGADT
jgi:hypothetical protein